MKHLKMFLASMAITTALMIGVGVNANDDAVEEVPLSVVQESVEVDGCDVSGQVVEREDGRYATFTIDNPGKKDATVTFSYSVNYTDSGSGMSRMMPAPVVVKTEQCVVEIAAGDTETVDILVQKIEPVEEADASESDTVEISEDIVTLGGSWDLQVWAQEDAAAELGAVNRLGRGSVTLDLSNSDDSK